LTLYTEVKAEGKIYNIPEHVRCQSCGEKAYRDSDVEPDGQNEDRYMAYYLCSNSHNTRAFVNLRREE
jgi:hypothetical protein